MSPGWSESSLGAQPHWWFCHVVAQLCSTSIIPTLDPLSAIWLGQQYFLQTCSSCTLYHIPYRTSSSLKIENIIKQETGRNLPPPCCVLEQDTLLPESTGYLTRKRWRRPDMTEKLLTGTLSLNTNKNKKLKYQFLLTWETSNIWIYFSLL